MASLSSTSLDLDQDMDEATELLEYQKAMSVSTLFYIYILSSVWPVLTNENLKAICKNLTPDTLTGELEFTDIFR